MTAYLISYDLRRVRNYGALIQQLREWQCVSPLESVWMGKFRGDSAIIRDVLRAHMDGDDGIMVMEIRPTSDWATAHVNDGGAEWLRANVGS